MKEKHCWQFIYDCLRQNRTVALLIVVDREGSTPGRVGFKMAVAEDGTLLGTIGGGAIEHRLVNQARTKLKHRDFSPLWQRLIHHKAATINTNHSGMICGGTQTVVLYPCQTGDLVTITELLQSLENPVSGKLCISQAGISFLPKQPQAETYQCRFESEYEWLYEETVGLINTAYIIGGGHVGWALSRILAMLDFHIIVLDERPEVSTFKHNTEAHEKITVSYKAIRQHIPEGNQNYVVIMTPTYQADELVLRQLLDKKLRYLGMIGSATKINQIIQSLQQEDIFPEKLPHFHAPIGLPIGSHTPVEIAVSIAAEFIQVKNTATDTQEHPDT
ncbi:MAG: hypothetical protein BWK78_03140 [Thiotrichaceae bacterium IS1]|nr:MAG: hypothetical protein BWK78_03140 [Thiotrichaceae bacterium IS1]